VLEPGRWRGATGSVEEFRESVGPSVCANGGDAVVAEINGIGEYVRGTVIRFAAANDAGLAQ
jgi:hypothetical protein